MVEGLLGLEATTILVEATVGLAVRRTVELTSCLVVRRRVIVRHGCVALLGLTSCRSLGWGGALRLLGTLLLTSLRV